MRPCIAMAFHLDWHSELGAHHADAAFVLGVDALAPIPLVFDRLINRLELNTANEHFSVAVGVPVRVHPKWHNRGELCFV